MSVRIMSEVWSLPHLNTSERLLLLAVADHCNDEGICYPSAERLRLKCGWSSTATYTKYINILKDAGLIIKTPRASTLTGRRTDLIELNLSNIHARELFDKLKASRDKFSNKNAINSHGRTNAPIKSFKPHEFTRLNTNHKGLCQEIKSLSQEGDNFVLQDECDSIITELDSKNKRSS